LYDSKSRGAAAYSALAKEMLARYAASADASQQPS
jgi:hypothetical protein